MAFDIKVVRKEQDKIPLDKRIESFDEVIVPFSKEDILEQTKRCLSCPKPQCEEGCPLHLPIRDMIKLISNGQEKEAFKLINDVSPLSGICAVECIRGIKDKPVNIGAIHRYVATLNEEYQINKCEANNKKIAIIGGGPSGLSCAYELYKLGYDVTIYEREKQIGGVANYGIPRFRLDKTILDNIYSFLSKTDIKFIFNKEVAIKDIENEYDAIYLATGTQKSKLMGIPGENLDGVYTSEEILKGADFFEKYSSLKNRLVKLSGKKEEKQKAIVVGGGNVAMDVARTLIRTHYDVTIVYRRSINEAPCRKDELDEAIEEGVNMAFLNNPVAFIGKDKLEAVQIIKMELGEADASGRRSPVEVKGSEYTLPCDIAVLAIGQGIEKQFVDGIDLNRNLVVINEQYQTSNPKVFAGGDVVSGSNTVVHAVKAGIEASKYIDLYLK